jgi:hypothetical protein
MVNFVYTITHTLDNAIFLIQTATPDKMGFWMDYDGDEFSNDTILRYSPNGGKFTLRSRLQFINPNIHSIQPFRIDNLSDLVETTYEPGDTVQLFVYLDHDLIPPEVPIFSIIVRVK